MIQFKNNLFVGPQCKHTKLIIDKNRRPLIADKWDSYESFESFGSINETEDRFLERES